MWKCFLIFVLFFFFCCWFCRLEMSLPSLPPATTHQRQKNAGSLLCQPTAESWPWTSLWTTLTLVSNRLQKLSYLSCLCSSFLSGLVLIQPFRVFRRNALCLRYIVLLYSGCWRRSTHQKHQDHRWGVSTDDGGVIWSQAVSRHLLLGWNRL